VGVSTARPDRSWRHGARVAETPAVAKQLQRTVSVLRPGRPAPGLALDTAAALAGHRSGGALVLLLDNAQRHEGGERREQDQQGRRDLHAGRLPRWLSKGEAAQPLPGQLDGGFAAARRWVPQRACAAGGHECSWHL